MVVKPWYEKDLETGSVRVVMNATLRKMLEEICAEEEASMSETCRYLLVQAIDARESK
jgi:hypothetical protein